MDKESSVDFKKLEQVWKLLGNEKNQLENKVLNKVSLPFKFFVCHACFLNLLNIDFYWIITCWDKIIVNHLQNKISSKFVSN